MYIYVIGSDSGPQKIGISSNPESRLSQLKTGSPFQISIKYSRLLNGEREARCVEGMSHLQLSENRMSGEWFDVSPETAISAVNSAIDRANICEPEESNNHSLRADWGYAPILVTAKLMKVARAMLYWGQSDLAERSGVSEISIKNIERGATDPRASTLAAIQRAFEDGGAIFLEPGALRSGGSGVRLRR